jgi:hypothetical protein
MEWAALIDTAEPTGLAEPGRVFSPGAEFPLRARSFALFVDRATGSSITGESDATPA